MSDTQEIRVGFEAALDVACPEWKVQWTQQQVDHARFFYNAAIRDTAVFVNNAISNMKEGYDWLNTNLMQPQIDVPVAASAELDTVDADAGMSAAIQESADAEPDESTDTATATVATEAPSDAI